MHRSSTSSEFRRRSLSDVSRANGPICGADARPSSRSIQFVRRHALDDTDSSCDVLDVPRGEAPTHQYGALGAALAAEPARAPPGRGDRIGRYVFIEEIGRGGMGIVCTAYDPKFERTVALKLLSPAVASDAARARTAHARLLREARALAKLHHPNIVMVHDVDAVAEQLCMVMEFVAGETLAKWVVQPGRTWHAIVEAYRQAGRGLAAAHAAGITHRDFKPANALIGPDGLVKVVDFGLAKNVETAIMHEGRPLRVAPDALDLLRPTSDMLLTRVGAFVGTPAYMAPEQYAKQSGAVGPATDQFSFGVALFEGLYGRLPFEGDDMRELHANILAGWIVAAPPDRGVPQRIHRAVLRALAADPSERHPSMDALIQEIAPRSSRARSLQYAALGCVALVMASGLGVGWQKRRSELCAGATVQLAGVWDEARREQVRASIDQVGASYARRVHEDAEAALNAYAVSWKEMHREACLATTMREEASSEVMDARMACLRRAKLHLHATVGELADADAELLANAHKLTESLPPVSQCWTVDAEQDGAAVPLPEDAERVERIRGRLADARAAEAGGRFQRALDYAQTARLEMSTVQLPALEGEVAATEGLILQRLGELDRAEEILRAGLRTAIEHRHRRAMQEVALWLVQVVGTEKKEVEAAAPYVALASGLVGDSSTSRATLAGVVGGFLRTSGALDAAEASFRDAVAAHEEALGPKSALTLNARVDLASLLVLRGRHEDARVELREAIALQIEALGPEHPKIARSRSVLGNVYQTQGRYDEAEAEYRSALDTFMRAMGLENKAVALVRSNLASVLLVRGRYQEAETEIRRALAINTKVLGPNSFTTAHTQGVLGDVLREWTKYADAEVEYRGALRVLDEVLSGHVSTAKTRLGLADALRWQGKLEDAEFESRRALTALVAQFGADHQRVATARLGLSNILHSRQKFVEAEAELRTALGLFEKHVGANHPSTASAARDLADNLYDLGRLGEAEVAYRASLAKWVSALGENDVHTLRCKTRLARLLLRRQQRREAAELASSVWALVEPPDAAGNPSLRGETAFVLAQVERDRARARSLARRAVAEFTRAGESARKDREAVEAWLRTHARG